jgi:very-short-patch-repair endonuclease
MGKKRKYPEFTSMSCWWCEKEFQLRTSEYNRWIKKGRNFFFCGRSCTAYYRNSKKENTVVLIIKTCPYCKNEFQSSTAKKSSTFCSRRCASAGSVTEYRRMIAKQSTGGNFTINQIAAGLRVRESWKYEQIKQELLNKHETFEFEYVLPGGNYIYDLALLDKKIFVEFDSPYHKEAKSKERDIKKDIYAEKFGWKVIRIKTKFNTVIDKNVVNYIYATG